MTASNLVESTSDIARHDDLGSSWARLGVPIGCASFIVALIGSAVVVPPVRVLHFFQALIYVAVMYFGRRNSALAFGAGVTVAVVWNALQLFITHNAQGGLVAVWSYLETGVARRVDTMFVPLGTLAHFMLIVACLAAFLRRPAGRPWWRFFAGGVIGLGYFVLIVATLLPR